MFQQHIIAYYSGHQVNLLLNHKHSLLWAVTLQIINEQIISDSARQFYLFFLDCFVSRKRGERVTDMTTTPDFHKQNPWTPRRLLPLLWIVYFSFPYYNFAFIKKKKKKSKYKST